MKKQGLLTISLLAAMILGLSISGCGTTEPVDPLEKEAQEIYRSLMCPLCPGQTIDQSQTALSSQIRALVQEKLAAGETREEILQFFVDRYGETVLAEPVKSGFNLIVWIAPILVILIGGVALWIIIRQRVRGKGDGAQAAPVQSDGRDEKYEEQLEKDLENFDERGFR